MESVATQVSIVVPVYNDEKRLEKCLEALEYQTYPKDRYEVIVVDNASTVDIQSVVNKFRQSHYYYEKRSGSYAARNTGLKLVTGEIIAFTDSDCIPAQNWIERGVSALKKNPDCGLVGGAIKLFYKKQNRLTGVELYESLKGFPQKEYIEKQNFGATANVFTFPKIFDEVGKFNSDLKSGGDSDWGKRVAKAGYPLLYAEDVQVNHPARSTYSEIYKKIVRVMGGLPAFRKSNKSLVRIFGRLLKGVFIPPVPKIRKILAEVNGESANQKAKLTLAVLFIHYVWVLEEARLRIKNG